MTRQKYKKILNPIVLTLLILMLIVISLSGKAFPAPHPEEFSLQHFKTAQEELIGGKGFYAGRTIKTYLNRAIGKS